MSSGLLGLVNYPDPNCTDLVNAACKKWGISSEEILFYNGATEILYMLPRLGFISGYKENILEIRNQMPPWSVNSIAQIVGEAALRDNDYVKNTKNK